MAEDKTMRQALEDQRGKESKQRKKKTETKDIADEIMEKLIFKTPMDTGEIFFYNDGTYHQNGEALINEECKRIDEDMTKHDANEVIFHIQTKTYAKRDDMQSEKHMIHLNNGIFDMKGGDLKEFSPDIFSMVSLLIKHDSDADCPNIKKFLSEVLHSSDIPVIQELFGYCLWKEYHIQKAFMFLGEGENGKSTLLSLLRIFLNNKNVSSIALQNLETNRFAAASLYNKLANIYADISDKALKQTGIFKILTGGDSITAERKFKDCFSFVNYAKLIFSANKLPEVHDDTNAYFRRWIIINFPNSFADEKADKNLLGKLTTDRELSGLFNWCIIGINRLLKNGVFSRSESTEEIKEDYERKSNSFLAFVKDFVVFETEHELSKEFFYKYYIKYCKKHKLPTKDKATISKEIARQCPSVVTSQPRILGKKVWCWRGLKVEQLEQLEQGLSLFKGREKKKEKREIKDSKAKVEKNPVPTVPTVPTEEKLRKWVEHSGKTDIIHRNALINLYSFTDDEIDELKKTGRIQEVTPEKYKIV